MQASNPGAIGSPFTLLETLQESAELLVYRGARENGQRVVLKVPRSSQPSQRALKRLQHEYDVLQALDTRAVARAYGLETHQGQPALVLEDFGGQPLSHLLGAPLALGHFLPLALRMAQALAELHRRHVVHKDLKPQNVLVHPVTEEVKLVDLGLASLLPSEYPELRSPSLMEGTLPYMSPEQTGRMNRVLDYRTDFYSLGIVYYEMLTGRLPFQARDPLEWVHCHMAHVPRPPHELLPSIPKPLSALVLKLLAKAAEERYQSAQGLCHDLERCLAQWEAQSRIELFPLGERDISERFQVPQKLYGRDRELAALLGAFERVVGRGIPELVLVSGYSGVGKSSLVSELHKPVVRERGTFLAGKFDQYKRDIPYITLAQAFRALVLELLVEDEETQALRRNQLREAMGLSGQLMVGLIPPLERLLGKQPPVPELSPTESASRFHRVFCQFIGVFARQEHPLVLFLDDLQWADAASLKLLKHLLTDPDTRHLLVIGAYRDNEVSASHPLTQALGEIRAAGAAVHDIILSPLSLEHVSQLISDTVHAPAQEVEPLAHLVLEKTGGNPFFALQFLHTLHEERLIEFDARVATWHWEVARIREKGFTDNVVELMVGKLKRLPAAAQELLQWAACMGNRAEISTLSSIASRTEEALQHELKEAVREGLVLRQGDTYRFLHDRVQQAAYSLIPEAQRQQMHLSMGRLLLAHTPPDRREERAFDLVNHLNRGAELMVEQQERDSVAELNLLAGRRAMASAAYSSAIHYLGAGATQLAADCWERQHALAFALHLERAQCEWLNGNLEEAEHLLTRLLPHARSRLDETAIHILQLEVYATRRDHGKAVQVGLDCLRLYGLMPPAHPGEEELRQAYEKVLQELAGRQPERLVDLPPMEDPELRALLRLILILLGPAGFTDQILSFLLICTAITFTLRHGFSQEAIGLFASFSNFLITWLGRGEEAHQFGRLTLAMMDRQGLVARTSQLFTLCNLEYRVRHVRSALELVMAGIQSGLQTGEQRFTCYCYIWSALFRLVAGHPLGGGLSARGASARFPDEDEQYPERLCPGCSALRPQHARPHP